MSDEPNNADEEVAKEILRYFLRYPDTTDNLAGIARWRLMQETVRHSVERTGKAMQWLTHRGFMQEEHRVATGTLFRLNPQLRDAAEQFLHDMDKGEQLG